MYIRDINNINYMYFNGNNVQLTLMVPTYVNNIYVNKNDKIYIVALCTYSFTLSFYVAYNHLY